MTDNSYIKKFNQFFENTLEESTDTDRVHKIMHKGEHVASIRTYRGRAGGLVSQAENPDGSDASKKYGIGLMDTKKEILSKIKKHHAKQVAEATIKSNKDGQSGGRGQTFSSYSPSSYKVLNDKGEHLATAHSAKDPKYGGRTTHWSVTWHKARHKDHPTSFQFMHQLKKHVKELNEDAEVMHTNENFIDGKGPGKSGDAARHGLKGKSAAELKKIRSSETASPRKKQLAHWMLNMHHNEETELQERGLWDNIHAKRKRIKAGSGERMRKPGSKGAPTAQDFRDAQEEYTEE